jgi:hypothetical protein
MGHASILIAMAGRNAPGYDRITMQAAGQQLQARGRHPSLYNNHPTALVYWPYKCISPGALAQNQLTLLFRLTYDGDAFIFKR